MIKDMSDQIYEAELKNLKVTGKKVATVTRRTEIAHVNRVKQLLKGNIPTEVKSRLKKYLSLRIGDSNEFGVEYVFSETSPDCRLYSRGLIGAQGFSADIRGYLMEGLYQDFDMENALFALTLSIAKLWNMPESEELVYYVSNRNAFLDQNGLQKQDVITTLLKSYKTPDIPLLKKIHEYIYGTFVPALHDRIEFRTFRDGSQKQKDGNYLSSFFAKVVFSYENKVLMAMDTFLAERGCQCDVLVFDGLQVRCDSENDAVSETLLKELSDHIFQQTQMKVNIREKPLIFTKEWLKGVGLEELPVEDDSDIGSDPEEKMFRQNLFEDAVLDSLAKKAIVVQSHDAVARFLAVLWGDDFYYNNGDWWFFNRHVWRKDTGGFITHKLLNEVRQLLDEKTSWKSKKIDETLWQRLNKLSFWIGDAPFYKNIIKTLAVYFEQKDFVLFEKKLESNHHLVCFRNGVYDLKEMSFRDGRPTDFCSLQLGYEYEAFDPSCPKTQKLMRMIMQVLPIESTRRYFLKSVAISLGCHTQDKINILHGGGANAKSWMMGLIIAAFDQYATTWNTSVLAGDINSEKPNPDLASAEYKRVIDVQECKKNKTINMETVKKLTGGDRTRVRFLYQNGKEIVVYATIFLSVNDLPIIVEVDEGTWRRMNVISFSSRFVDDPELVDESRHIYLADKEAKRSHEDFAQSFMSILIHSYQLYKDEGLETPESVVTDSLNFRKMNDVYNTFFDECCKLGTKDDKIHTQKLFAECQSWAAKQNNRELKVEKKDLIKWLKKLSEEENNAVKYEDRLSVSHYIGGRRLKKVSSGWRGIALNKFAEVQDEDEEDEVYESNACGEKVFKRMYSVVE